jgi:hypothetical protein
LFKSSRHSNKLWNTKTNWSRFIESTKNKSKDNTNLVFDISFLALLLIVGLFRRYQFINKKNNWKEKTFLITCSIFCPKKQHKNSKKRESFSKKMNSQLFYLLILRVLQLFWKSPWKISREHWLLFFKIWWNNW